MKALISPPRERATDADRARGRRHFFFFKKKKVQMLVLIEDGENERVPALNVDDRRIIQPVACNDEREVKVIEQVKVISGMFTFPRCEISLFGTIANRI